jgi:hypothetical protein
MSATNRGAKRVENDFYETPPECTRAIIPYLIEEGERGLNILDPCAGDCAIVSEVMRNRPGQNYSFWDIDESHEGMGTYRNALSNEPWLMLNGQEVDLIITNPPYKLAFEFVMRALYEVKLSGTVAMLLRLPFLESVARQEFHRDYPADIYVFAKRPSFTKNGKTDATAYAWFVWGPGRGGRWSILPHAKKAT